MEIKTIATTNKPISIARIPTSDFSMESGLKLQIELLNSKGLILDRQYLEIPLEEFPKLLVDGKEVEIANYLKAKILQLIELQEDANTTTTPTVKLPNARGLLEAVRGSEFFGKVFVLSESNAAVQREYTTISVALNSAYFKAEDLYFGLSNLQKTMGDRMSVDDVEFVNSLLIEYGFEFQLPD